MKLMHKAVKNVIYMFKENYPIDTIIKVTGLTEENLETIK